MNVRIERIYDSYNAPVEFRILVDRVWPRGISKEKARLDEWCKDIAPSSELRTWFGHIPERFDEFRIKYMAEIDANPKTPEFIALIKSHENTILLYSVKDTEHNQAVVLRDYLLSL